MKLKIQLKRYLEKHGGYISSGELQRQFFPKYAYGERKGFHTPRSVVRRLEELASEKIIQVEHRKGHSWYMAQPKPKRVIELIEKDGVMVAVETYV